MKRQWQPYQLQGFQHSGIVRVQPSARIASRSMSSMPGGTLQRVRRLLPAPARARAGNQGDIDLQSNAGATATGDVLTVSEDSDDHLAARVSLGALGVVSQRLHPARAR
jgi:hypothetical protein